jgi:hypothetical protein
VKRVQAGKARYLKMIPRKKKEGYFLPKRAAWYWGRPDSYVKNIEEILYRIKWPRREVGHSITAEVMYVQIILPFSRMT